MNYNTVSPYYQNYPYPQMQSAMNYGPAFQLPPQQAQAPVPAITPLQNQSSNIQWVQGEAAALAYPVAPGNTVILMDSENPVVYKKSTDEHGKPLPMDIYDLHKRENPTTGSSFVPNIDLNAYVKKSEIEAYISERIDKELDKRVSNLSFKPATRKKRIEDEEEE